MTENLHDSSGEDKEERERRNLSTENGGQPICKWKCNTQKKNKIQQQEGKKVEFMETLLKTTITTATSPKHKEEEKKNQQQQIQIELLKCAKTT